MKVSDSLYGKVVDIMEIVHNLDGNCDLSEVGKVIDSLKSLTTEDLEEMDGLPHSDDYEMYGVE